MHAVARRPQKPDAAAEASARAIAERIREAVISARSSEDFQQIAKALPHSGVEVVVEPLTAFTREGRVSEGNEGNVDAAFATAAYALEDVGSTSGVVESAFGWHVIRLEARIPEQRMPLETRRIAFTDETYTLRTGTATSARLGALKASTRIEVAASAELLMRSLVDTAARGPIP